ncbi:MAG: hypothetical protein ACNA7W_12760 [Pseudomonadales bacterium]
MSSNLGMEFLELRLRAMRRWATVVPAVSLLALAGLLFQQAAAADAAAAAESEAAAVLEAALEGAPPSAEQRCAYTRIRIGPDSSKAERFDPSDPENPWTLLSLDGREPTAADLRRFSSKDLDDRIHPLAFDPRDMIREGSWELVSENGVEAVYEFQLQPYEALDERLAEKVIGTLVIDRTEGRLVRIRIENTEPTFVAPLVRITDYAHELRFERDEAVGTDVLVQTITHMRGRAVGVRRLRQDRVIRYEDYVCSDDLLAQPRAEQP